MFICVANLAHRAFLIVVAVGLSAPTRAADTVPVRIERHGTAYTLLRGGRPYFVDGVGGTGRMDLLKRLGGNSVRTWGADGLFPTLDEAQSLGLTVTIGIWLGHKEHGFDYTDQAKVSAQLEQARTFVEAYKNHPAVLFWALGNEMEINGNDTEAMWRAVDQIAKMVKEHDPNHPTMTIVADIDQSKIDRIKRFAPNIDVLGVNSYGGAPSVGKRLKEYGWTRPFMLTEFGPLGQWERPKTPWGTPIEQTSSEKADAYRATYEKTVSAYPGWCLGSYAFLWGAKDEATPTWYGLFLPSGELLGGIDVLSEKWTGKPVADPAPRIETVRFDADQKVVSPGKLLRASVKTSRAQLIQWRLCADSGSDTLDAASGPDVEIQAPWLPGNYRLYVYVYDGKNHAAVANVPFRVER